MTLENLKGVGEKTVNYLYAANIFNIDDLLSNFPYRYEIQTPELLLNIPDDTIVTINATVLDRGSVSYLKRNLNILRFKVETSGIKINVSIFNRAFLKSYLKIGNDVTLTGKYKSKSRTFTASNMKFQKLTKKRIIPVYHTIKGIKPSSYIDIVFNAVKNLDYVIDYLPAEILSKYNFSDKKDALYNIHFPKDEVSLKMARKRLVYEEFFVFLFKVYYLKMLRSNDKSLKKVFDESKVNAFMNNLSFSLTNDQLNAVRAGLEDFHNNKRMNRLLLGDVGSGKTIVAIILMYANFLAGYQSAFMAPTEILATQHFFSIYSYLKQFSVHVELLIGSMSKKEKKVVIDKVRKGEVDILVGTHAILNEDLKFFNLGFVVTDEQHRFGVNQRNTLQEKGFKPDVLFMSATPIPRTYALALYGDMDNTYIKEKPCGRKEIITKVKNSSELKEVLYKILEQVKLGYQVYVVAPMIEENDDDVLNVNLLKEKFDMAYHYKIPIGVLHGKLKSASKDEVMNDFKNGRTKILISTTVIEVGVDVKKATTIVVFNAERFGLATLHQLRGRVGRNDVQSYCYLICNQDVKRLQVMEESNDGFYISEKDFEFRGEGDLFGSRQSGDINFKLGNLQQDKDIFLQVKSDLEKWFCKGEYQKMTNFKKIIDELKFNN